jgi:putative peptidoglycan lipid II flippase
MSVETNTKPQPSKFSYVARSSILIAVFFAVDKLLGLARQAIIGRQFGVSQELDAFNAANNLPDLLFAIISGGALAIAFIPILSETMERAGRRAAWELFSRVANWAFLVTGVLSIIFALFASQIVESEMGVAPGFTPELQVLVTDLMRLDLIATLLFSLSGLVIASLQANQHFLLPALAPVVFDLGQIFGAVVLAPTEGYQIAGISLPALGLGVHGLVYGVILGAALHFGVQIPGLIRYGFRWTPKLGLKHEGLRKVARLMTPRIFTIGAFQLIFVLQDNLASRLDVGSVTALAYGWLIMQVPETIIGTAIGTAILPTLSEFIAKKDTHSFELSLSRTIRVILALTLPITVLLMLGIRPLVEVVFDFDTHGTDLVVWAARAYLVGLVGHSLLEIAARAFYAQQNAKLPLIAAGVSMLVFFGLSIALYQPLGAAGIGLSNSIAFSLEAIFLLFLLRRQVPGILRHGRALLRIVLGTLLGGLVTLGLLEILHLPKLILAMVSLGLGGMVVLPFIWKELKELRKL